MNEKILEKIIKQTDIQIKINDNTIKSIKILLIVSFILVIWVSVLTIMSISNAT